MKGRTSLDARPAEVEDPGLWDTTVCHDYVISGGQVQEGNACGLPQFQWFQCPPGTTPVPQMPLIPNK